MPVKIVDLDNGRGNLISGAGTLTSKDYLKALKKHLSQDTEKFKRYKYSLADFTNVTKVEEFPSDDIELVAHLCRQAARINSDPLVVIVADQDLLFGLSRMWEILMDETGWNIKVFRTRDAAETWIKEKAHKSFGIKDLTFR